MKALSVRQPWAGLIASGLKTIELRSWRTSYRGPLLICAAKRFDQSRAAFEAASRASMTWSPSVIRAKFGVGGIALCYVTLLDVRPAMQRDTLEAQTVVGTGLYAWCLTNVRPLVRTFAVTGKQGLFDAPEY